MRKIHRTYPCAALCGAALMSMSAQGADFDGSKALICAPSEVFDCTSGAQCWSGSPKSAGAPSFLRIDFTKKTVIGEKLTSKILNMDKTDEQIILQGVEMKMGWTVVVNRTTGAVAITLADHDGAFVMFGACTVP